MKVVLERAIAVERDVRAAFVADACAADADLRRQVETLLASYDSAEAFLESPAISSSNVLREDLTGRVVGTDRVEAIIGAGVMGEVYRAEDTRFCRDVAIKILPCAFTADPERLARFEREARLLAALNHPNVATIHGIEESNGVRALVMELVEGETLAERIARGPLPIEEVLAIARQIAEALNAAHEKGIVHRDVKPANVKITTDGTVKVLDFGLAKLETRGGLTSDLRQSAMVPVGDTREGLILGTAAYMSPEQARGRVVDKRTDIWAFGCVLYEMLSGRPVFARDTVSDTIAMILEREPDWTALPATTPTNIPHLLRRCLEKDWKRRLRDIGEARFQLDDLPSLMGSVSPESLGPLRRPPRRASASLAAMLASIIAARRIVLPTLGAALTLAVGIGAFLLYWRTSAIRPAAPPLIRLSVDLGLDAVAGVRSTAVISPDGTRLAFPVRGPDGEVKLATRLLDQSTPTLLAGTERAVDPFFSPDGQSIGFFADGKLKKILVLGGAATTLCDAPDDRGATWGEDGNIIVTLDTVNGTGLSRVPTSGGTPQSLTSPASNGELTHRWPQLLPGGNAILFTANVTYASFNDANIDVLSLRTGRIKTLLRGGYFGRYLAAGASDGYLVYVHDGILYGVRFDLARLEVRGAATPLLDDVAGNVTSAGGQLDFSRTGTFVYLSGKGIGSTWLVVWMDSSGKTQPLVTAPGAYFTPSFSPDGQRLALAAVAGRGRDLYVYDGRRGTQSRLTFTGQGTSHPVWTPDAQHIVFKADAIRWMRTDGRGEPQLLLDNKDVSRTPRSFSPDGRRLAYEESGRATGYDIWILPLDLTDPDHPKPGRPDLFLRTPFDETDPMFSPDGRWIAYWSNDSGRGEIYVRPSQGSSGASGDRWQISTDGARYVFWSRNGRELFYTAPDDRIMVVSYTVQGDTFTADRPRRWSDAQTRPQPSDWLQTLDLAPDGKRFAIFSRSEAASENKGSLHVTFLLNFFDELRRRLPEGK